jgi:hypothetical protein
MYPQSKQKESSMNIIKTALESINIRVGLKEKYKNKIKQQVKLNSEELDERAAISSRRYLTSVCFKISATSALCKMNNKIFAPIGYYYC